MKPSKLIPLVAATLVLSAATACSSGSNNGINTGSNSQNSTVQTPATQTAQSRQTTQSPQVADTGTESSQARTKTDTISVEGEKSEVTLKLYDQARSAFTTYYPENDFIPDSDRIDEGTSAQFYFNAGNTLNKDVFVGMYFPTKPTTLEQLKQVAQERGLIQPNQWQQVNRTNDVPYSWAKEKIVYQRRGGSEPIQGEVYLGEADGKTFYVVTHYPAEYAEGFGPRADMILKNLDVSD